MRIARHRQGSVCRLHDNSPRCACRCWVLHLPRDVELGQSDHRRTQRRGHEWAKPTRGIHIRHDSHHRRDRAAPYFTCCDGLPARLAQVTDWRQGPTTTTKLSCRCCWTVALTNITRVRPAIVCALLTACGPWDPVAVVLHAGSEQHVTFCTNYSRN